MLFWREGEATSQHADISSTRASKPKSVKLLVCVRVCCFEEAYLYGKYWVMPAVGSSSTTHIVQKFERV